MRELRRDPITGGWVVFADERVGRPREYAAASAPVLGIPCPFCPGHEEFTPPEILALGRGGTKPDSPGWRVRVVPNLYPALAPGPLHHIHEGLQERMSAVGGHEVVVETPEHEGGWEARDPALLAEVWRACRTRIGVLARTPGVRQVLAFKNHGEAAGATLAHPHLQITALPVVAPAVEAELSAAGAGPPGGCRFCDLLDRELAAGERVIAAGEDFVLLAPYASRFPYEVWILPRSHQARFEEAPDALLEPLARACREAVGRLAALLDRPAYNAVLHTAPVGGGEERPYHWHLEVLPRTVHAAGFEWGAGMHLNPVFPEEAARALRAVSLAR